MRIFLACSKIFVSNNLVKVVQDMVPGGYNIVLFLLCFLVTPINQLLIILGRCTLYTPVCLQDESTCMRIEPV